MTKPEQLNFTAVRCHANWFTRTNRVYSDEALKHHDSQNCYTFCHGVAWPRFPETLFGRKPRTWPGRKEHFRCGVHQGFDAVAAEAAHAGRRLHTCLKRGCAERPSQKRGNNRQPSHRDAQLGATVAVFCSTAFAGFRCRGHLRGGKTRNSAKG